MPRVGPTPTQLREDPDVTRSVRSAFALTQRRATSTAAPPAETTNPHQRQGDRGTDDADDASEAERLKAERLEAKRVARRNRLIRSGFPVFVRYDDFRRSPVSLHWTQLLRMIDDEGFPAGILISANVRAWRLGEMETWLAPRPIARKIVPSDAVHHVSATNAAPLRRCNHEDDAERAAAVEVR